MAREKNFLLGHGEQLTGPVEHSSSSRPKNPPYDFKRARSRMTQKLEATVAELETLPDDACPDGQVVAVVTLHPRYLSKSDYPHDLLSEAGLRAVGSKPRQVRPESWGIQRHSEEAVTDDVFVAGTRESFRRWSSQLPSWSEETRAGQQLAQIEDLAPFRAPDKVRSIPSDQAEVLLEVVLHNARSSRIVKAFTAYVADHGSTAVTDRQKSVRGLTFLPVRAPRNRVAEIAGFSFVRAVRGMPSLRPLETSLLRSVSTPVELPTDEPYDPSLHVAIFDGGISTSAQAALRPWVTVIDAPGLGPPRPEGEEHGLAVTSSLLFGPLSRNLPAPRPICRVDHYRVLDALSGVGDMEYLDVLDRIVNTLRSTKGQYRFANISIGPRLPCEDDDVTEWTARLDSELVGGGTLTCVAAGNDGEMDQASGLHRIQPPADGVNVVAVGSSSSPSATWERPAYSCMGPGRSPGIVKPDGVAFGGSDAEPFAVLSPELGLAYKTGTSFAAPYALRSGVSVAAQLGEALSPLAIRALLIHRADPGANEHVEVGWGRFDNDPVRLITSEDDEALVVYQGELPLSKYLRAPIPIPDGALKGNVTVSATLVIAPEVDPEYPDSYTRGGLQVTFRPNADRFTTNPNGSQSHHPTSQPFFSAVNMHGASERRYREDGLKWEPCLRATRMFRSTTLREPCFDIYFNHRESGVKASNPSPISYALLVGIGVPQVPDLYNQVVRAYANILLPIAPQLQIRLQA